MVFIEEINQQMNLVFNFKCLLQFQVNNKSLYMYFQKLMPVELLKSLRVKQDLKELKQLDNKNLLQVKM